jgi:hypothetical protein
LFHESQDGGGRPRRYESQLAIHEVTWHRANPTVQGSKPGLGKLLVGRICSGSKIFPLVCEAQTIISRRPSV